MPTGTGTGTETYPIDTDAEWQEGTFADVVTTGSGAIQLADATGTLTFDYSLDTDSATGEGASTATATIRDADTGTVLASDSADRNSDIDNTFTADIGAHGSLEFAVNVSTSDFGSASASISGPATNGGPDTTLVSVSIGENDSASDTRTETYTYAGSGTWTSPNWDFTNTTTATKLSWSGVTLPNAGDDITVTVENSDGTNTYSESVTAGSGEVLFEIAPDAQYRVVVDMSTADDDITPEVGSLTLETHTPTDGLQVADSRETEQDISWNELSVCDGYELYQSEETPVELSDALAYSNTDSTATSTTVSGLENGEAYYYNVRPIYSGE